MTSQEIIAKLMSLRPRESFCYHTGWLIYDRKDPVIDQIGKTAMSQAFIGKIHLTQKRRETETDKDKPNYDYIATGAVNAPRY